MRLRAALAVLLGGGVGLAGCASTRQHQAVVEEMYEYVYPRPLEAVWPEVERFISEEGYPPRKGEEQGLLISDWKMSFQENRVASAAERVVVEGRPLNRANSEVRIYRESFMRGNRGPMTIRENHNGSQVLVLTWDDENPLEYDPIYFAHKAGQERDPMLKPPKNVNHVVKRDVELEWRLLQRMEPKEARRLEEKAQGRR
jgi:hypothetical protein